MDSKLASTENLAESRRFDFSLGDDIYLLVSCYNNYISIGIRECIQCGSYLLPSKHGINLMIRQYHELIKNKDTIISSLTDNYKQFRLDLSFNVYAEIITNYGSSSSINGTRLLIENTLRNYKIELGLTHFEAILRQKENISRAIDDLFKPLGPNCAIKPKPTIIYAVPRKSETDMDIITGEKDYVSICVTVAQKLVSKVSKISANSKNEIDLEDFSDIRLVEKNFILSKFGKINLSNILKKLNDYSKIIRTLFTRFILENKPDLNDKLIPHITAFEEKYLNNTEGRDIIYNSFMEHVN
jgi:hypothetical protein